MIKIRRFHCKFRCMLERTQEKNLFVVPTVVNNFHNCEITSTIEAYMRALGNSQRPVQNAANISTTVAI